MERDTEIHNDLDPVVGIVLKHLAFLQHAPSQAASTRGNVIFTFIFIIGLQPVIAVCTNWQHWNFQSRVSAIDNLLFSLGAFCLSVDVYLGSEKLRILVNLTQSGYQLYSICSKVSRDSEPKVLKENVCNSIRSVRENSEDNILGYSKADGLGKTNSYDTNNNDLFYKRQENHDFSNENLEYATQTTVEGFRGSSGINPIMNSGNNSKTNDFFSNNEKEEWELYGIAKNNGNKTLKNNFSLKKKQKLVKRVTLEGSWRAKITASVNTYFFISFTLVPLWGFVCYLLRIKSIGDLPLPFLIYSPFSFTLDITTLYEYILLALADMFYIYYAAVLAIFVHLIQLLSVNNLLGEMRLFHLNARELDELFENVPNGVESSEKVLRLAARELVIHHQTIFRKVKLMNDGSNFRLFYMNSYICLQIVFGIFIFLKGDLIYKIKYGLMVLSITLVQYIFSENGQKLQDEGERLRMSLYECNWIGTPAWFTRSLQNMIIRSNTLPRVGLLNVFTLNRNNVSVVIRGAYSYLNVLNKMS